MKRVAFYLRVSTKEQTTENQRRELEAVAARSGWEVVEVYEDAGISGAKGRDKRPAFDRLLKDATRRKFDLVAAWSVDRLGRSMADLVSFLNELNSLKVGLYLHQQALDTSTPQGSIFFQMVGLFGEFERIMIQERVRAGIQRTKATGKTKTGRPVGGQTLPQHVREEIVRLKGEGKSFRQVAKEVGVSPYTVQRYVKEAVGAA